MAGQTTLMNGSAHDDLEGVSRNTSRLAAHMLVLGEMQAQLISTELHELMRRAGWAVVAALAALGLLLAALPTALLGLGYYLAAAFEWQTYTGLFVAALSALVAAGLLVGVVIVLLRKGELFERSRSELRANWNLLKRMLSDRDPSIG